MNLKSIINVLRPTSFWRMDNFSDNNIYDEYGVNTLVNHNALLGQTGCENLNLSNTSINLKGGYVDSTDTSLTNTANATGDLAISFNFKCDTEIVGQHPIISKWFPDNQWYVGFEDGNLVAKYQTDTTLHEIYIDNKDVIYNGRWNHVQFIIGTTNVTLTMNGDSQGEHGLRTLVITGSAQLSVNSPFRLGGDASYTFTQDCFINDVSITANISYSAMSMYILTRSEEERYLDLAPMYYFDITEAVERGTNGEVINKGTKGDTIKGYLAGNDISTFTLSNETTFNNKKMVKFIDGSYFTIDDIIELDLTGEFSATIMMDTAWSTSYVSTTITTAVLYPFYFSNTGNVWRYNTRLRAYYNDPLLILETFDGAGTQLNLNTAWTQSVNGHPTYLAMGTHTYRMGASGEQETKMLPIEYAESRFSYNYPAISPSYTPPSNQTFTENKFFWNDGIEPYYSDSSIEKLVIFNRNVSYTEQARLRYPTPILINLLLRNLSPHFGWYSGITNTYETIKHLYSDSWSQLGYTRTNITSELQQDDPLYNRLNDWNGTIKGNDNTSLIASYSIHTAYKRQYLYQLFAYNLNTTNSFLLMRIGYGSGEYLNVFVNQRDGVFSHGSLEITSNYQTFDNFQSSGSPIINDGFHLISVARIGNRFELYIDGILDAVMFTTSIYNYSSINIASYPDNCYINNIMYCEGDTDAYEFDNIPGLVEFTFQGYNSTVNGVTTIDNTPIPSAVHTLDSRSLSKLDTTITDNNGNFSLTLPKSQETRGKYLMSLPIDENATSNVVVHGPYATASTYEQNIQEILGDVQDMVIDMEPELYYPMNDTSLPILDYSGNSLDGTMVGTDYTLNQAGSEDNSKSILFGTLANTHIELPVGNFTDFSKGFTFSCWFKQNTIPTSTYIPLMVLGSDDTNGSGYFKLQLTATLLYFMDGTTTAYRSISYAYDLGVWTNIVMRIKPDLTIEFIINGTLLWNGTVASMPVNQARDFARFAFSPVNHSMDESNISHGMIYDYPLSDEDITKQVNRGFGYNTQTLKSNILFDSPEAYYTFDRLKTVSEEIGSYDLTVNGSVIYSKNSLVVNHDVVGNNYLYNDTYKIDPVTNGGTIEFNFKTTGTHTQSVVVSEWSNSSSTGTYKFTLIAGGVLRVYLVNELTFLDSTILFNDSKFHHVALTISGNDFELFVDNVSQDTVTLTPYVPGTPVTNYNAFDVEIDETLVPEDLYNFPLLVNIDTNSGLTNFDTTAMFADLNIPTTANDDFTGTDGDLPNSDIWDFVNYDVDLTAHTLDIQTNKLDISLTHTGSSAKVGVDGKYVLVGDFDVEVDVADCFGSAGDNTYAWLRFREGLIGTIAIRLRNNGVLEWYSNVGGFNVYSRTNSYGKLRMTRVDDLVTSYTKDGDDVSWTQRESVVKDTLDVSIQLEVYSEDSDTSGTSNSSANFDNFTINSGTVRWDELKKIKATYIKPTIPYATVVNSLTPVAYWRLGESIGQTVAVDETTNYNGTYVNTPILETTGLLVEDTDTAVTFVDTDEFNATLAISVPSGFSVSFILTPLSLSNASENRIGTTGSWGQFLFHQDNTDAHGVYCGTDLATRFTPTDLPNILYVDKTVHIIYVYDGTTGYFYSNGVLISSKIQTAPTASTLDAMIIGGIAGNNRIVDELCVFNYPLTQTQVSSLSNSALQTNVATRSCKLEIDRWDQTNSQAQLWVKVPFVSSLAKTVVNIAYDPNYYDNSDDTGYTGNTPAQDVWDMYDAVFHLSKDGTDSTANALHGTLNNIDETNIVDFGVGKGLILNGTDEYIHYGDVLDIRDADISISSIVSVTDVTTNQNYVNKSNVSGDSGRYFNGVSTSKARLFLDTIANKDLLGNTTLTNNTTYEIASTFNRNGDATLYLDGVNDGSIDISDGNGIDYNTTMPFRIGAFTDTDNTTPIDLTTGKLKEIRVSKTLKTEGWISTNSDSTTDTLVRYTDAYAHINDAYESGVMGLDPVSYYRLGELTGTVVNDETGNSEGVYINSPTLGTTGLLVNDTNTAVTFGATDNRFTVASPTVLDADFSISFLMNTSLLGIYQTIIRHLTSHAIYIHNGQFNFYNVGDNLIGPILSIDTLYHVVLVRENGIVKVYIDGVTDGTTLAHTDTLSGTECFGNSSGEQFKGIIDEFVILNYALSQIQVSDLYRLSLAYVNQPQTYDEFVDYNIPTAYWRLSDPTIIDYNDDFTGTDGDLPNADLWVHDTTTPTIQNNSIESNGTYVTRSHHLISGDFNIQVDFSNFGIVGGGAITSRTGLIVISDSLYLNIYRAKGSSSDVYKIFGYSDSEISSTQTHTSGKLRIIREGSTVKLYYWSGTQWEWDGNINGYTAVGSGTNDLNFYFYTNIYDSTSMTTTFDNFTINSGTIKQLCVDETGNYNGSYVNTPTLETTGLLVEDTDTAVLLNGVDEYIGIPHSSSFNSDSQSYCVIIKAPSSIPTDSKGILFKAPDTGFDREFGLSIKLTTGYVSFTVNDGVSLTSEILSTTNVCDGGIYHIVAVKTYTLNNDKIELYINGVLEDSLDIGFNGVQNTNEIVIGKVSSTSTADRHYPDVIDEVSIFNSPYNQSQVTELYNSSITGYVQETPGAGSGTGLNTYGNHRMTVGSDDSGDTNAKLASKTWIDDLAFYGKVLGSVRRSEHYDRFVDKKDTLINDL